MAEAGVAAGTDNGSKMPLILGAVAAVAVLAIGAFVVFGGGGDDEAADPVTTEDVAQDEPAATVEEPVAADTTVAPDTTAVPDTTQPEPEAPDDATIQAQVAGVIGSDLGVVVTNGVALLTGATDNDSANNAVSAAQSVEGVVDVNDAIVRLAENEVCTDDIRSQERWVCLTNVEFDGTTLFALYDFGLPDSNPSFEDEGGYHLHFFDGGVDEPIDAGTPNGGLSNGNGNWDIWDDPTGYRVDPFSVFKGVVPSQLCVEIANPTHSIENLESGTCFPVTMVQNLTTPDVEASISRRRAVTDDSYVCSIG